LYAVQDINLQLEAGGKDKQMERKSNHQGMGTAGGPDRPQKHVRKLQNSGLDRLNRELNQAVNQAGNWEIDGNCGINRV
jgi:hypothetical protein